jgi:4-amino-4-deoxy-L-arabinose transferase-like glycosyltransferase
LSHSFPPSPRRAWLFPLALLLACAAALLPDLPAHVVQKDEGRYLTAAREMALGGDWIVPRLGGAERLQKPPLVYWVTASAFRMFGMNEPAARLGSLLAGLLGGLVIFLLGRAMFGAGAGAAAAVALLSSPAYTQMEQAVQPDMLLCLFFTLTMAAAWWALQSGRWLPYLLAGVAAAAAVLTKGPLALGLPLLILAAYLTLTREWRRVRWFPALAAAGVCLALAAPWFLAVEARYPGFLRYTLVNENLERYGSGTDRPDPFWFYLPVALIGMFPWSVSLALLRRPERAAPATAFLWIWFGVTLLFFSLARFKMPWYLLPGLPPLALLAGAGWGEALGAAGERPLEPRQRQAGCWLAGALALGAAGVLLLAWSVPSARPEQQFAAGVPLAGALAAGCCLCLLGLRRNTRRALFAGVALAAILVAAAGRRGHAALDQDTDAAPLAARMAALAGPDDLLVAYDWGGKTAFPFYLERALPPGRRVLYLPPVRPTRVAFAVSRPALPRPAPQDELLAALRSGRGTYCLISKEAFRQLRPELAAARCETILGQTRAHLLITNRVGL